MANFRFHNIEEIDKVIKAKEIFWTLVYVPCNPGGTIIGEGSAATVFPF